LNFKEINNLKLQTNDFWIPENIKTNTKTIVTLFYDIQKITHARYEHYKNKDSHLLFDEWSQKLIKTECNIVFIVNKELAPIIKEKRKNMLNRTVILTFDLKKSPYYLYKPLIKKCFFEKRSAFMIPIGVMHQVILPVTWSKIKALETVADKNYFNSDVIVWVDYGLFKINSGKHTSEELKTIVDKAPINKIKICLIQDSSEDEVSNLKSFLEKKRWKTIAGYFSIPVDKFLIFKREWDSVLTQSLKLGLPASEEQLFSVIIAKNRDLFSIYFGDYQYIITNQTTYINNFALTHSNLENCLNGGLWDSLEILIKVVCQSLETGDLKFNINQQITIFNKILFEAWKNKKNGIVNIVCSYLCHT
jgi:hypothetical protein